MRESRQRTTADSSGSLPPVSGTCAQSVAVKSPRKKSPSKALSAPIDAFLLARLCQLDTATMFAVVFGFPAKFLKLLFQFFQFFVGEVLEIDKCVARACLRTNQSV